MIGIYKITSPSGKIYIGQSVNISNRLSKYKNLNCKSQRVLYNSIIKYGWDYHKFEVLCECDIEELNDKERYYQDLFNVVGSKGLNCMLTTTSTKTGKASKETISILTGRKLSDNTREKMRNRKVSKETRLKISESNKGRVVSDETKNKISQSNKGKIRTKECIEKMKQRIVSEEQLTRLKTINIGRKATPEIRKKLSDAGKNKKISDLFFIKSKESNSKIILDTQTGIFYNSASELSDLLGIKRTTLTAKLSGQNKNNTNYVYC